MVGICFVSEEVRDEKQRCGENHQHEAGRQRGGGDCRCPAPAGEYGKILPAPPPGGRHHACLPAVWKTRGTEGRQEGKEVLFGQMPYQLVEQPPVGDQ